MEIKLSLGFTVVVHENGTFELPQRLYTTAELRKITTEINRTLRKSIISANAGEVLEDEE